MKQLLFISMLCWSVSHAQIAPEIEWQKSYGTILYDNALAAIQNNLGEYVIAGYNSGISGDSECSNGGSDYWITVLNPDGDISWQKCYGGSSSEIPAAIIQTPDHGYAIAGYTHSTDGDVSSHYGIAFNADYWIVKTDSLGNIDWENNLGGISNDYATCIQITLDNGFIVSGYTVSTTGDVTDNNGNYDYWVVKLNSEGEIEWEQTLGGSNEDYAYSIIQLPEGNYIVCGYSWSTNGDVTGNHGAQDAWVVKLNEDGGIIWQKCYGGSGYDQMKSITPTNDGNFLLAGYTFNSTDGDVSGNHGDYDIWLIEIDGEGNLNWQKCLGGNKFEISNSVANCFDGGYFICGYTNSNNEDVSNCHECDADHGDQWVIKTNHEGNILWERSLGGTDEDVAYCGFQVTDGFLIAGASRSGDYDATFNNGETDEWIIKLQCDSVQTFYADADGDAFGNPFELTEGCGSIAGYVANSSDCNDENELIHPGMPEVCNGFDDNCNVLIDEDLIMYTFYIDADGDEYGNPLIDSVSCLLMLPGYVANDTDCDDLNENVYPGAPEIADGIDNNCNEVIDEGVGIEQMELIDLVIYPNPAADHFEINASSEINIEYIEICSIHGDFIERMIYTGDPVYINHLTAGNYIVRILTKDAVYFRLIMKG